MHGPDQLENPFVTDIIVDIVRVLAEIDDALIPQNVEMLRNIGICGLDLGANLPHREFAFLEQAEYLQANRV